MGLHVRGVSIIWLMHVVSDRIRCSGPIDWEMNLLDVGIVWLVFCFCKTGGVDSSFFRVVGVKCFVLFLGNFRLVLG